MSLPRTVDRYYRLSPRRFQRFLTSNRRPRIFISTYESSWPVGSSKVALRQHRATIPYSIRVGRSHDEARDMATGVFPTDSSPASFSPVSFSSTVAHNDLFLVRTTTSYKERFSLLSSRFLNGCSTTLLEFYVTFVGGSSNCFPLNFVMVRTDEWTKRRSREITFASDKIVPYSKVS